MGRDKSTRQITIGDFIMSIFGCAPLRRDRQANRSDRCDESEE
jgi:hypothetical protein